jgi:Polyketide cyclase / dehydrase and lipid transport
MPQAVLRPSSLLSLLFGFATRVDRRTYVTSGVLLMLAKYSLDVSVAWAITGEWWSPWRYLSPVWSVRMAQFPQAPSALLLGLGLMTLPFFWIGVSMSVRRAADAGLPPLVGLAFAIPGVNFFVIFGLSLAASLPAATWSASDEQPDETVPLVRSALTAIVLATLLGIVMGAFAATGWSAYGFMLFFATPLAMGVIAGYLTNRPTPGSLFITVIAGILATALTAGGLLLFALEGVICIMMAGPIALTIVIVGALIGRAVAIYSRPATASILVIVASVPMLGLTERFTATPVVHEVVTTIEIEAPAETVWAHVVGFSDLPPPADWVFSTGIAYPIRARLTGTGVGAVRSCEFSTGAFIEPITAWEPGRRLAFDVRSQPPAMKEWSFYASLHPPHLDTLLRSRRGEFRLIRRADGGTHLEGRTWYELTASPPVYWKLWADGIIHRIHARVLAHIRRLSEDGLSAPLAQSGRLR